MENPKDINIGPVVTTVFSFATVAINCDAPIPTTMPIAPPTRDMTMASMRNWVIIVRYVAPSALRTPISRVRSVTDTSIIFIIPMPPTSKEIAATAPRNKVMVAVFSSTAFIMDDILLTLKSSRSGFLIP